MPLKFILSGVRVGMISIADCFIRLTDDPVSTRSDNGCRESVVFNLPRGRDVLEGSEVVLSMYSVL